MIHRPASSQPRLAGRHIPGIRRTLATLGGLAGFLTAAIGLAPTASATPAPPEPSFAPVPPLPPPAAVPAHFPPWAIAAILAATIVLSVATTLITLALEHARWARREAAAIPEPQASARTPVTTPAHQAEILSSHPARDRA
jgi:hypothetical protein